MRRSTVMDLFSWKSRDINNNQMKYYITHDAFSHPRQIVTFAIINKNLEGIYISTRIADHIYIASAIKEAWDRKNDPEEVIRVIK